MAAGRVKACPLPSGVRSLTPDPSFYVHSSWRRLGPRGTCALGRGGARALEVGLASPDIERDGARAPGSDEAELTPLGSDEARPTPLGRAKSRSLL
jgi:hypothetical protein